MSHLSADSPPSETLTVRTPEQFKALGHPFRQRLLFHLGEHPATISQLATVIAARKGTVAHHLKMLLGAGLVRLAYTRTVRGGTEVYYERTAHLLVLDSTATETGPAMLHAVADEFASAVGEPLLHLRHLRLAPDEVRRLTHALAELVRTAQQGDDNHPTHSVLVSLYQRAE